MTSRPLADRKCTGCTKADGLGGPPKCESGEVEGTQVEVFPILGSEGGFVRRSSIDRVLQFNLKGLYGVYQVPANAYREDYWPAGRYGLVLIGDDEGAMTLLVEDGGIVRIVYHLEPLEMALAHDVGDWLLPPATASPSRVTPTP